jgi:ATP-dependent Clp protease protease subunit
MTTAQMKPFERIFSSSLKLRCAQIYGEINMSDVSYLEALFFHFADQGRQRSKPVTLSIFTGGGSLDASLALYDLIRAYRERFPVRALAIGSCMSGGVIVMQAATERLSYPHSRFMVHELALIGGNLSLTAQQKEVEEAMRLHRVVRDILFEHSSVDLEKLRKSHGPVDHYLTAEAALKLGLIDRIVSPES